VVLALFLTGAGIGVQRALPLFWDDWQEALDTERAGKVVLALAPPGSAVFGIQDEILHLQFAGDYRLYSRNLFVRHFIAEMGKIDGRSPDALQPEWAQALYSLLRGRSKVELARLERGLMAAEIREGRRVFLIAPARKEHWVEFTNPGLDASDGLRFATRRLALWRGPGEERPDGDREPGGADWQLLEVTAAPRGEPSSPAS
jgi:hypothetical protein